MLAVVHKGPVQRRGQERVSAFCILPLSLQNPLSGFANLGFVRILEQQWMVAGG